MSTSLVFSGTEQDPGLLRCTQAPSVSPRRCAAVPKEARGRDKNTPGAERGHTEPGLISTAREVLGGESAALVKFCP